MRRKYLIVLILMAAVITGLWSIQGCRNGSPGEHRDTTAGRGGVSSGDQGSGQAGSFVFKERLSEYGFFKGKLANLDPTRKLTSYELVTPLFTDYALKDRFIVLPAGKRIHYLPEGVMVFPDSTIIIKNFAYRNPGHQKIMIETRLLVKDPGDGAWAVMDYLWDSTQTDAVKHITGAKVPITLLDDNGKAISTVYQVPNTNDCKRCHTNNSILSPIGPKARNLNFTRQGYTVNQLAAWNQQSMIEGLPALNQIAQLPDWKDAKHYSLEQRARAYLDVNCAHCHTPGGDALNTGLFLEYQQTDPQHLGILKSPVSAGGGAGGLDYDIVPGDAAHSILAYRMNSTEPGTAMPELARTVIHQEAVRLIVDWINHIKKK